jgi:hypothetical protein
VITSIRARSGFAADLPGLRRTIALAPGLNVLFGPNGSGKTTLLRLAAAYCCCPEEGGWSGYVPPLVVGLNGDPTYPACCAAIAPRGCTAEVAWDGTPSYSYTVTSDTPLVASFDEKRIFTSMESMRLRGDGASEGQRKLAGLGKLQTLLRDPPDPTALPDDYHRHNDVWQRMMTGFRDYASSLPRTGPVTILIDEPDRSLSVPQTALLWGEVLPELARTHQVIVASHALHALGVGANVIETAPGYHAEVRAALARHPIRLD